MLQQNWNQKSKKTSTKEVLLKENTALFIPKKIGDKIKYLCNAISQVEWSGILLYITEGSIKDPKNFKFIVKDIIPMHKGTSGYTEYHFNEQKRDSSGYEDRMIDYFNERPEALTERWKIGHIHSHNSMPVFFSGTDMEELHDNAPSHNIYLSLIVNNRMELCAKACFTATIEESVQGIYKAFDESGKKYDLDAGTIKLKREKLFIHDCKIETEETLLDIDSIFIKNVEEIINKDKFQHNHRDLNTGQGYKTQKIPNYFDDRPAEPLGYKKPEFFKSVPEASPFTADFIIDLLIGNSKPSIKTVSAALKHFNTTAAKGTAPYNIVKTFLEEYPEVFREFFGEEEDPFFISVTEEVIKSFDKYKNTYLYLHGIIQGLKLMIEKFDE